MSMMNSETAEPSSESGQLLHEDTTKAGFSCAAAAELRSPVYHTSRRKRRRTTASTASPMETHRKRSRRFEGGTAVMTSRYSRPPGSASYAQEQDEDWLSRRHLRRRRPHTAIRTEYLGVSSTTFAPPLRRYLESPQHGRRALRSTTPSSATRSNQSPFGFSGCGVVGESAAATIVEHVGRPISKGSQEQDRRARFYRAASCSTNLRGERHATTLVDTVELENLDDFTGPREQQPLGRCPPPEFLTPVGPDWWGESPENQAASRVPAPLTDGDDYGDRSNGIDQQLLTSKEERHSSENAVGSGDESDSHRSSQQEPCQNSSGSEDEGGPTSRGERSPARPTVRGSHRRRRAVRSSAWDLLTGRRMERGRRKGSRDIHTSDVSTIGSQWTILETW